MKRPSVVGGFQISSSKRFANSVTNAKECSMKTGTSVISKISTFGRSICVGMSVAMMTMPVTQVSHAMPGNSQCTSGQNNLLVNGSFELTSNPNYSSAAELIDSIGRTAQGVKFIDRHPDTDFPGWFTTGGIPLQQGGFSQGGTLELGLNGFLGFETPDGEVFAELDGNNHNQIISVTPGQLLDWQFTHRGRVGPDTVSISLGPVDLQSVIATVTTSNKAWVTHTGQYQVPDNVDEIQLTLTPVAASNGDIDSSHLLDDVRLCVADGVPSDPGPQQCTATSNLALNGSASQSSSWRGTRFPANYAIDGDLGNFTHTDLNQSPASWQVTLDEDSIIEQIVLHNRDNCCGSRLRDITVTIINSAGGVTYQSALLNPENTLNSPAFITLNLPQSVTGSIIEVQRTPDPDLSGGGRGSAETTVLSLGEVQVNGCESTSPTAFVPDPNKLYHIDNPAHGLRLAATANSEILESRSFNSTGVNTQWRFVQSATAGLWHIQRAAGGSTPRIRTVLTTTPDMQSTGSSGTWTRFSITPNSSRPGTYLLTVPLANTENQRLRLLSSGATDFSTNNNTGNNPSFVFTEVD